MPRGLDASPPLFCLRIRGLSQALSRRRPRGCTQHDGCMIYDSRSPLEKENKQTATAHTHTDPFRLHSVMNSLASLEEQQESDGSKRRRDAAAAAAAAEERDSRCRCPRLLPSLPHRKRVIKYCLGSGFCAAAASATGKLASDPLLLWRRMLQLRNLSCRSLDGAIPVGDVCASFEPDSPAATASSLEPGSLGYLSLQAAFLLAMMLLNSFMWTLYSKALSTATSATEAAVMNTGCNFAFTALLSFTLFGEGGDSLNSRWFAGSLVMLIGLLLLQSDARPAPEQTVTPHEGCTGIDGSAPTDGNDEGTGKEKQM